jgi:hypothetical protein
MSCCGNGTKVKDDPLAFRNHYPLPVRVMVGVFGLVLLSLPYYLLVAPGWNHFSWILIPFGLIGIVAGLAGLSFCLSALLGEAREAKVDLAEQVLMQTSRGLSFRSKRMLVTPFTDIAFFEMKRPSWAQEEAVLMLVPVLENGDSLPAFGSFPSKEEAQKVMALMGHMPDGPAGVAKHWSASELEALKRSIEAQSHKGSCSHGQKSCGCH